LIFLRARPGDRERVQVTERGAPEGDSESVAILPVPTAESEPLPKSTKPSASAVAQGAPKSLADKAESASSPESDGNSAFDAALAAFKDGRYGEARRQFEDVAARGGAQAAEASLYAAQSAKNGEGCAVAVSLFDQVATRHPGTRFGYDATWQAASCYETLGDTERAKRSYQALLDDPSYGDRAKTNLASLERAEQRPVEVAARKAAAEAPPPAAPASQSRAGAAEKSKAAGSATVDREPQDNVGSGR
jgi:TolA-binding protein